MTADYNLSAIRDLLLAAFNVEALRGLFSFAKNHDLRPVADEFTPEDGKPAMVRKAVDYCQSHFLVDELLAEVKEANPRAHARFERRLHAPEDDTPVQSAADPFQAPRLLDEVASRQPEPYFSHTDYQYEIKMFTQTYREASRAFGVHKLEREREKLTSRVHELELDVQKLELKNAEALRQVDLQMRSGRWRSFLVWAFSVVALVAFGIGINFVAGRDPSMHTAGRWLLAFGVALEALGFIASRWWDGAK